MTILIAANTSWNLVHFRGNLIRSMQASGHSVIACAPRDQFTTSLVEMSVSYCETPMQQRGLSILGDLRLIARYLQIIRTERPEAILTFTIKPNLYLSIAGALCRVPVINNISGLGYAFVSGSILRRFVIALHRLCLTRSARVFFQNPEDQALFAELGLVSHSQSRLLPGSGVDLSRFQFAPAKDEGALKFLFIGRLLTEKGIQEYLDAARALIGQGFIAEFLILGEMPDEPDKKHQILNQIRAMGDSVRYLGVVTDVRPAVSESHCVVLPSYREGAPRSILEASAMGRPVIVTDVPGCNTVVKDNVTGLLCRPMDAADLAEKMKRMMSFSRKERAQMGEAGAKLMRDCFDERIVLDAYEQAIAECVGHRH